MSDTDSVSSSVMDFSGDAAPTAVDPYFDDDMSARPQSELNELREDLCYDDLNYLNEHKEVEAIATLVLKEVLKNRPKNPMAHAACYLSDPRTSNSIANFVKSRNFITAKLVNRDTKMYATTPAMVINAQTDNESGHSEMTNNEQIHEQTEEQYVKQNEEPKEKQDEIQDYKKNEKQGEKHDEKHDEQWIRTKSSI